ncbi:MAG TPA: IS200/IS605 family transposase [Puia sp.]|nr:IS200/IS605 family transposase [Puia sp.]
MQYGNKTYLFIHAIWRTQEGELFLTKPVRNVLFSHIRTAAEEKMVKILIINGVEDHVHCLFQLHPMQTLSKVIKDIKSESARWINENKIVAGTFDWQDNYVAYSVSPSALKQVWEYIERQEEHHKTKTLENELEIFEKIQF